MWLWLDGWRLQPKIATRHRSASRNHLITTHNTETCNATERDCQVGLVWQFGTNDEEHDQTARIPLVAHPAWLSLSEGIVEIIKKALMFYLEQNIICLIHIIHHKPLIICRRWNECQKGARCLCIRLALSQRFTRVPKVSTTLTCISSALLMVYPGLCKCF